MGNPHNCTTWSLLVDELDAAILREMHRDRDVLWGGSDPRVRAPELAKRLDVNRTTVWSRLKAWEDAGFLVRQEVVPNPSLFGAGIAGGDIRIDDPTSKPQALERLQLVEGVLAGLDLVGPYVILFYALESQAALDRCTRLVGELPDVDNVSMCVPFEAPGSQIEPTEQDWRILQALRASPEEPLKDVAKNAGVSSRTLRRRYDELLEANAVWSFPVLDFSKYHGAVLARFTAILATSGGTEAFVNTCQRDLDGMVLWDALEKLAPTTTTVHPWVDVFCHLASAGEVEEVKRWMLTLPTVDAVEVSFPRSWFVVEPWFDERVQRHTRP